MNRIIIRLSELVGIGNTRDLTQEEKQETKELEGQLSAILQSRNKN